MNNKIKNAIYIFIIALVTVGVVGNSLFTQDLQKTRALLDKVRNAYASNFPEDFTANITSRDLSKELRSVPDYEKINPDNPFVIKFIFLKEYGERIIVENACMLTRNKFQNYIEVYQSFRSFLDPSITSKSFFRKNEWKLVDENKKFYVIKMSERGIKDGYYQIYINKHNLLVERTFYFKDGSETGRVDIDYKKDGKFMIPEVIKGVTNIVNEENKLERKKFEIKLDKFKLNQGLTVDDILCDEGIDC